MSYFSIAILHHHDCTKKSLFVVLFEQRNGRKESSRSPTTETLMSFFP